MNEQHMGLLVSDDWRAVLRELVFPYALAGLSDRDLGDDVLEIGPGPGLTTDILSPRVPSLTALEFDPVLAASLTERLSDAPGVTVEEGDATAMAFDDQSFSAVVSFTMLHHVPTAELQDGLFSEVARVLRPGGLFVANDSVASPDLAELHHGDVYNPVDPMTLAERLAAAGFTQIDVRSNGLFWAVQARRPWRPDRYDRVRPVASDVTSAEDARSTSRQPSGVRRPASLKVASQPDDGIQWSSD